MKHHKKKQRLPGIVQPNIIVAVPSRPPAGCEGHPAVNAIAGNVASGSGMAPAGGTGGAGSTGGGPAA